MSLWSKRAVATATERAEATPGSMSTPQLKPGEYQLLHKYLRDRYATRVVLTFAEIEDLLGFALPEAARVQREWWDAGGYRSAHSSQADSWRLASRSAVVNLSAQSVIFDREEPVAARTGS